MMLRRTFILATVLALTMLTTGTAARAAVPAPTAMAALGDSITRAYNTGPSAFQDYPANSWSTGTNATVGSHYTRLRAQNTALVAYNDAVSGAKAADVAAQASAANAQHVDYITILIGGNDVCTSSESTMTSVPSFRASVDAALTSLAQGSPNAHIYLLSVPDVYNLWAILHTNGSARFVWTLFGVCQSMLARPSSTLQADVDRRARVSQRNKDFNTELAAACAAYSPVAPDPTVSASGTCRYDGGAAFNTKFAVTDVSTRDYFHPSVAGQTKLAAVSWSAGYWGP
jgi:lysophospholipase L1-like esterase